MLFRSKTSLHENSDKHKTMFGMSRDRIPNTQNKHPIYQVTACQREQT